MANETLSLLPQMGKLNQWLRNAEKELQKEFGKQLKLCISGVGNDFGIDAIVKMVSDKLSVPINRVLGKQKATPELEARQIAMYLCHKYIPMATYVEIGQFFDKDHTTAIHAVERIESFLSAGDDSITHKVAICESEIHDRLKTEYENATDIHEG